MYIFNAFLIIQVFSFVCILTWSLLGVKKKKAWASPKSVFFRGLIQNFRRASPLLLYAEFPPPPQTPRPSLCSSDSIKHLYAFTTSLNLELLSSVTFNEVGDISVPPFGKELKSYWPF